MCMCAYVYVNRCVKEREREDCVCVNGYVCQRLSACVCFFDVYMKIGASMCVRERESWRER